MRFFSTLVASTLGTLIAFGVCFVFFLLFLFSLTFSVDVAPPVRAGSVLHLDLSGTFPEQAPDDLTEALFPTSRALLLRDVVQALEKAAVDDRIAAVWLQPEGIGGSWADVQELRAALEAYKASGKPLIASSGPDGMGEPDYFLATAADAIFAPPEAFFEFNGFYLAVQFYDDLLDRLDVEPQIVRAGGFKSAVEPFMRSDLSPENATQLRAVVETVEGVFAETVARSRGMDVAYVREIASRAAPVRVAEAYELGLIDSLFYPERVESYLKDLLERGPDDDLTTIRLGDYVGVPAADAGLKRGTEGTIAVVYGIGDIMSDEDGIGFGSGEILSAERIIRTLEQVREDDRVDAVVLRIESPGGSSAASDVIWREIERTRDEKPVVVSMGAVAASGGYYLAAPADLIVAQPTSLTGSIGVFTLFFNLGETFENKLGITRDVVRSAPHADMFSGMRALTAREQELLQQSVEQTYETFLARVAEGRGMPVDSVRRIAEGRVWSGADAVNVGLVDELGGLDHAVRRAAELAELAPDSYRLRYLPPPKSLFELLESSPFRAVRSGLRAWSATPAERAVADLLAPLLRLRAWHGTVQARLPFDVGYGGDWHRR